MIDPATLGMFGTMLGATVVYILREHSKGKNEKSNNGHLETITKQMATKEQLDETNEKIGKIDKTVGIMNTNVENMQANCKTTTGRFGKEINNNRNKIFDMAKKRK